MLKPENIFLNRVPKIKADFLKDLIDDFAKNINLTPAEQQEIESGIFEREDSVSTGIGNGVAIPHCRKDILQTPQLCCAIIPKGMDFHSLDGKPTKIVFLTFSQTRNAKEYMQLLAHLSRLLTSKKLRERLTKVKTTEEFLNAFAEIEGKDEEATVNSQKYLIGLILGDEEYEKDAINAFVESGVINAQIIDSTAVSSALQFSIPLFSSFGFGSKSEKFNKYIFGFSDNKNDSHKIYQILKESGYDINEPGAGAIFSIKIDDLIGGNPADFDM